MNQQNLLSRRISHYSFILLSSVCFLSVTVAGELTVHMDQPGATVSPTLYGLFFEDINRAGDGGLYAELVQNRSFEDNESLRASAHVLDDVRQWKP
jgi:hypothetical protein